MLAAPLNLDQAVNQALTGPGIGLVLAVAAIVLGVGAFLLMTSFTRIVVVLSFVRTAVGTPMAPPNMVIVGLALVLTVVTMEPTLAALDRVALAPYAAGHISLVQAVARAEGPMRAFLLQGTTPQNLGILYHALHRAAPANPAAVPFSVLVVAYAISQLTLAFQMALMVYLPFLVVDLVVASILMSLGMIMVPPTVVSLPVKLLLFVAVNGWGLVVGSLIAQAH